MASEARWSSYFERTVASETRWSSYFERTVASETRWSRFRAPEAPWRSDCTVITGVFERQEATKLEKPEKLEKLEKLRNPVRRPSTRTETLV